MMRMPAFFRASALLAALAGCATANRHNQGVVDDFSLSGDAKLLSSCVYERAEAGYPDAEIKLVPLAGRYVVEVASAGGGARVSIWSAEYSDLGGGQVHVVARAFPTVWGAPYEWKTGAAMTAACARTTSGQHG